MQKANEIDEYALSNREKNQRSNKGKFWCNGCDASLVGNVGKCPHCGWENSSKKHIKVP